MRIIRKILYRFQNIQEGIETINRVCLQVAFTSGVTSIAIFGLALTESVDAWMGNAD